MIFRIQIHKQTMNSDPGSDLVLEMGFKERKNFFFNKFFFSLNKFLTQTREMEKSELNVFAYFC